ncbi:MAG: hypothetical protein FJX75_15320 [Armatimonadetes bacterium]|nr:hypothetical protein [Armatimonadota bacterium]
MPSQHRWALAVLLPVLAAGSVLTAPPAHAHQRNFAYTYEWFTPFPGEDEIELWLTYNAEASTMDYWLEYETAVTDRYAQGVYVMFEDAPHSAFAWAGVKWEHRYCFGEFAADRWLHAAYLEWKKEPGEPHELEAKWLLSRYAQDDSVLAINLIAEKALEAGHPVEWGYAAGWNRPVGKDWRAGAESKGSFSEGEYYLGPNATFDLGNRSRIIGTALAGLTPASEDLSLRLVAEWEFF